MVRKVGPTVLVEQDICKKKLKADSKTKKSDLRLSPGIKK